MLKAPILFIVRLARRDEQAPIGTPSGALVHFLIALIHIEPDLPVKRSAQHSERSGQIDPGNRLAGSLLE